MRPRRGGHAVNYLTTSSDVVALPFFYCSGTGTRPTTTHLETPPKFTDRSHVRRKRHASFSTRGSIIPMRLFDNVLLKCKRLEQWRLQAMEVLLMTSSAIERQWKLILASTSAMMSLIWTYPQRTVTGRTLQVAVTESKVSSSYIPSI